MIGLGCYRNVYLFRIKQNNKWYCSEWILYALRISNIIDWKVIKIFDQADLSPAKIT